ncbi:hypothetical protein G9F32_05285 [Acinetobacter sp. 194]|uniref:hypothetical protein n=1 Tax=Acinetobacter shaoyimingii TaxID=2715164 RepID=UPI00140C0D3B|nr:hypothetical protein [Acinetobacter shaoyimingii]NHB57450.1 hypothetical protein [Acinetobacter shaoyimingii]
MTLKFALLSCLILNATIASADININVDRKVHSETPLQQVTLLTQEQYDQQIEQYIAQVNETKKNLDGPEAEADATLQKKALCQRIQAYEGIYALSEQNNTLKNAAMMQYVAKAFLDRQQQSLKSSGMGEKGFCVVKQDQPNDFVSSR